MKKLVFCLSLLFCLNAFAKDYMSSRQLNDYINSEDKNKNLVALGYIVAVVDSFKGIFFCPKEEIKLDDYVFMTRKSLEIHLEKNSESPANRFVLIGPMQTFPCEKGDRKPDGLEKFL